MRAASATGAVGDRAVTHGDQCHAMARHHLAHSGHGRSSYQAVQVFASSVTHALSTNDWTYGERSSMVKISDTERADDDVSGLASLRDRRPAMRW